MTIIDLSDLPKYFAKSLCELTKCLTGVLKHNKYSDMGFSLKAGMSYRGNNVLPSCPCIVAKLLSAYQHYFASSRVKLN